MGSSKIELISLGAITICAGNPRVMFTCNTVTHYLGIFLNPDGFDMADLLIFMQ